jgi:hypothetical protein
LTAPIDEILTLPGVKLDEWPPEEIRSTETRDDGIIGSIIAEPVVIQRPRPIPARAAPPAHSREKPNEVVKLTKWGIL